MSNKTETVREVCIDLSMTAVRIGYRRPSDMGEICLIANRILAANERELAEKDAEIARLVTKCNRLIAALKSVLECDITDCGIRLSSASPCAVCDWSTVGCEQDCKQLAIFKAVREAQRIMKE